MGRILTNYSFTALTVLFLAFSTLFYFTQPRIEFANGAGFDGVKYVKTVEQIKAGEPINNPAPFVYRLAAPFLVSILPIKPLNGFLILNLVCALLSVLLLNYWLRKFLKWPWLSFALSVFFMVHWAGSLRFSFYYPASCDPMAILFVLLGLIMLKSIRDRFTTIKVVGLCILVFLGAFVREFIPIIALGILPMRVLTYSNKSVFIDRKTLKRNSIATLIAILSGALGILMTHLLTVPTESGYGFIHAVYRWIHEKSIFQWITAYFYVFGVMWIFILLFYREALKLLKKESYLIPILISGLILTYIGGGDTERFIFWFMPIFFLLIGFLIEKKWSFFSKKRIWIPLLLSLVFTLRLFWAIPQAFIKTADFESVPFFTILGDVDYIDLWSYHGDKVLTTFNLLWYGLLSIYFAFQYVFVEKKELVKWTN